MEEFDFNDCCNFILNKSPKSNCDFTNLHKFFLFYTFGHLKRRLLR